MWDSLTQHGDFLSSSSSSCCWGDTATGIFSQYPFPMTLPSPSDTHSAATAHAFGSADGSSHPMNDNGETPTSCHSDAVLPSVSMPHTGSAEPSPMTTQMVPCKFFASGGCTRGSQCPFQHDLTVNATTDVDASRGFVLTGQVVNLQSHSSFPAAKQQQQQQRLQIRQQSSTSSASLSSSSSVGLNPGAAPFSLPHTHTDGYRCNPVSQFAPHGQPMHSGVAPHPNLTYDPGHQPQHSDYDYDNGFHYGDEGNESYPGGAYGYSDETHQHLERLEHLSCYPPPDVTATTSIALSASENYAAGTYSYHTAAAYGSSFDAVGEASASGDYSEAMVTSVHNHHHHHLDSSNVHPARWRPSGVFTQQQHQLPHDASTLSSGRQLRGQADLAALAQQNSSSSSAAWYEQRRQQAMRPPLQTSKGSSTSSQASLSEEDVADRAAATVTTSAATRHQPSSTGVHGATFATTRRWRVE